jgi:hypothetical protein
MDYVLRVTHTLTRTPLVKPVYLISARLRSSYKPTENANNAKSIPTKMRQEKVA